MTTYELLQQVLPGNRQKKGLQSLPCKREEGKFTLISKQPSCQRLLEDASLLLSKVSQDRVGNRESRLALDTILELMNILSLSHLINCLTTCYPSMLSNPSTH